MPRLNGPRLMRTMGLLILLLLTAAGGWRVRGWQHSNDPSTPTSAEPTTARVTKSRIEQTVKARGIVKPAPNALLRIGFPMPKDMARRIRVMKFVEGDAVKAGDELALLDHADLLATLKQLKADAVVVEKRLAASRTLEPVEVHVAKALTEQTKAQADQAQRNNERVSQLRTTSAVAQQEYETALSDMQVAKAKLEIAEASLQQVKTRFQTDIATLEAQVEQAKVAIKSVEVQID